jgi:peptidoglycan/xylan/chitin deacetylase (PgdA/CDA1 family)
VLAGCSWPPKPFATSKSSQPSPSTSTISLSQELIVLFVVGSVARVRPVLIREAAERGHVVGSHSMTHPRLGQADRARVRAELRDSRFILEDVTGRACEAFRAPFFDPPRELGSLLEETGYRWSSSKAAFSPVAHYRWLRDSKAPHRLIGSQVVELPIGRILGLPMPDGLSYRRLFWPLTALSPRPTGMFYLHPCELLESVDSFDLPFLPRRLMVRRHGAWSRRHLWKLVDAGRLAGVTYVPPGDELLARIA